MTNDLLVESILEGEELLSADQEEELTTKILTNMLFIHHKHLVSEDKHAKSIIVFERKHQRKTSHFKNSPWIDSNKKTNKKYNPVMFQKNLVIEDFKA